MKKVFRLVALVLLLGGALSHVSLADGGGPIPTCDPADPNCKIPPPAQVMVR